MQWQHKTNLEWLKARQKYLTATDIKDLIPLTKTGRPRTVTTDDYMKVLARKQVMLTENDTISTGAAARGHMLEPYAIDFLNNKLGYTAWHHWDDALIHNAKEDLLLSFSPDGMNIPQTSDKIEYSVDEIKEANRIVEIKSYNESSHICKGNTNKKQLEERWQIATAFAVDQSLISATLLFFNPSMKETIYGFNYSRNDLYDEIHIIYEIAAEWKKFINNPKQCLADFTIEIPITEQDIINDIIYQQQLNP